MPEILIYVQDNLPELSTAGLFFLFFFGTFISEDAACLLAGTAVSMGRVGFAAAVISCFLGIFAGDLLLFGVGRVLGSKVFENRLVKRMVSERSVSKASRWLENNAASAVFISRFATGLRLPTYLAAGALRTGFIKFAAYFLLASAIWTPILVGSTAFSQSLIFPKSAFLGLIVVAVALRLILKLSSYKGRRRFIGRLKRIVKWEFWPIQVFYAPVVIYVVFLAIKHRGLTIFTAANPAIAGGGFKGESKNDIYNSLRHSTSAKPFLLNHLLIKGSDLPIGRRSKSWCFIEEQSLCFPMVLKPDAGERGKNVTIVRSAEELEKILIEANSDMILQEFAPGEEISVFYYRYPGEKNGKIFSITEKRFPVVVGDGISTIEDLIISDARAVCLAEKYFDYNRNRLEHRAAPGEEVKIIDIGTHSRGAVFLDGGWMETDALRKKIDEICVGFSGFYFGRFDIRTPSIDDLTQGENFKIIELNGVTSESTNIYDPRYSLAGAYKILFRQWRIAFEIGAENIKLGARPSRISDLAKLILGIKLTNTEPVTTPIRPITAGR